MSGDVEALDGFVTAGLAAEAIDRPSHGTAVHHGKCANCDTPLNGVFCSKCGQHAHIHRTLAGVGHDFLHGITHFDGKTWTTLPMLAFRPGKLTREYIEGKRARYVGPVPLFLLVIFLMFFVFSFVHLNPGNFGAIATSAGTKAGLDREIAKIDTDLATARALPASDPSREGQIAGLQGARAGIVTALGQIEARSDGRPATLEDFPIKLGKEIEDNIESGKLDVNLGSESLNQEVLKAIKNPQLFLYKVQSKAYKLSFLLVPLSLPWLWLIFALRRGVGMYDHAVFALYSISFMSILFIIGSAALALGITDGTLFQILFLYAPITHIFFQLKGAYRLGIWSAAWRTMALAIASVISLSLYLVLIVVLGLTG
jgi:hypothetical protein